MFEIKVHKGDTIEKTLRRFKLRTDAEGLIDEVRMRKQFMTKGQRRKYKRKQLDRSIKAQNNR